MGEVHFFCKYFGKRSMRRKTVRKKGEEVRGGGGIISTIIVRGGNVKTLI